MDSCARCSESGDDEALSLAARHELQMGLKGRLQYMQQKKEGKTHGLEPPGGFRQKRALRGIQELRSRKNISTQWFWVVWYRDQQHQHPRELV